MQVTAVYICPSCNSPSIFVPYSNVQIPGKSIGGELKHVPENVYGHYNEARKCVTQGCYTAAVLVSRKILMNVAVEEGAKPNESFNYYVTFIKDSGLVPGKSQNWLDRIRVKGNEATHEVPNMSESDAHELLKFLEMMLKFVYEFPHEFRISEAKG